MWGVHVVFLALAVEIFCFVVLVKIPFKLAADRRGKQNKLMCA